ncbi:centrosomal cep57l1 isoform X1 [Pelobates cultripes]|uniref:Centrosomal protein 57kDa-like protein 1 n=1 Tax=Pelobates cultripes TaxID=61616 RepID=A0AAD1RFF9_PELCU|nr:centrosomal cep57l1 isoform X1 [Pelobates cultripes]
MDSLLKDSMLASFGQPPKGIPLPDLFESSSSGKTSSSPLKLSNSHSYDILQAPNSKALFTALKTLQEKICRLELEKSRAHDHLASLSTETVQHKAIFDSANEGKDAPQNEVTQQKSDLVTQVDAAKQRCSLLEKQLEYMRKMVQNAEIEKNAVAEEAFLHQDKTQDKREVHFKLEKVDQLQKECTRLANTHQTTESKIHQLEEKLCAEQHQRKLLQDKAAQLQTGLEVNRIFLSSVSAQKVPAYKIKKKKQVKKSPVSKAPIKHVLPKNKELPFVAGKSTTSSHSLSANVQTVLHMVKLHSSRVSQPQKKDVERKPFRGLPASRPTPSSSVSFTGDSLTDVLLALQDELGQMSLEHQELLKLINETEDNGVREDLEREMDYLVKQMETKSEQILKLKRHQENVKKKKSTQPVKKLPTSARPAQTIKCVSTEAPATPRTKQGSLVRSSPIPKNKTSLQLLKSAQKIQMTLKKDDIMWEK